MTGNPRRLRIGVFMPSLAGGGLERVMLAIASGLAARGHAVSLLPCRHEGRLAGALPTNVRLESLEPSASWQGRLAALRADPGSALALFRPFLLAPKAPKPLPFLPALARWLATTRPDALIACTPEENLVALQARRLARTSTRLVLTEHSTFSIAVRHAHTMSYRTLPALMARQYRFADAVVAVSTGVADDLSRTIGLPRHRIRVIHNPVVPPDVAERAAAAVDHPWLRPGESPMVLAVGRLAAPKDFPTLLRAFARLRRDRPVRLIILGEAGDARATAKRSKQLLDLARELGVPADIALPGYVDNPFAWMARASVLAVSSRWEGLCNVIAEALACGCPVVSTDCPSGPAEILEGGRWGRLVPVGDEAAMAAAIAATLDSPPDAAELRRRGAAFSVDAAVGHYERLLFHLIGHPIPTLAVPESQSV
jgi:glycosyltransferase involved in cell wall biosynthesis